MYCVRRLLFVHSGVLACVDPETLTTIVVNETEKCYSFVPSDAINQIHCSSEEVAIPGLLFCCLIWFLIFRLVSSTNDAEYKCGKGLK